jgi:chlorite dismutase
MPLVRTFSEKVWKVPTSGRSPRLVDVDDVIAAVAELPAHGAYGVWREGHVRDGPIGGQPDGASKRDELLPHLALLWARAAMQPYGERVVGVERGEDARLVPGGGELRGERIYVAGDATGIGPRVRREKRDPHGLLLYPPEPSRAGRRCDNQGMSTRHFVKYTFLKMEPEWRRLDPERRAQDKREFAAACEDFADGHQLQTLSLVGTRGDAELLLVSEAENLDRIHEFHVVLAQSGLMQWAQTPYSFLGMRKSSEYSDDERNIVRGFRGRYVFVYPFVKSREWYALPAEERWRIMQGHIQVGREYPGVDNHTTYSFGLDDQEFVVAFDTDDVGTFLDLVQRLRTTEASRFTIRDTPSFTCLAMSLERALNALDGEPVALEALPSV